MRTTSMAVIAAGVMTFGLVALPQAQRPGAPPAAPPAGVAASADPRVAKLKALVDADVSSPAMYDLGQQMNDMA